LAATPWGWAAGILAAFAIVRDATLPGEPPAGAALWAGATAVGVTVRVALAGTLGDWPSPDSTQAVIVAAGALSAIVAARPVDVLSLSDWTRQPLLPQRLQEARIFGAVSAGVAFAAAGGPGVTAMAPLWLTYVVVAVAGLRARLAG
ncbi:MAG TPA: hypothetical protein VE173_05085, partial [Longimicrobiales bacterium]|nr:hypothetical protein [Longimicrobiales bacterium]